MKLRTQLTATEVEEKRERIVELLSERAEVDQAKKEAAKDYREQLKILDKRIEALRAEAAEGYDLREVEVDEKVTGKMVTIFRTDTGEAVSRRRMTASEKEAREAQDELLDLDDEDTEGDGESAPAGRQAPRRGADDDDPDDDPDPWEDLDARAREIGQ